MGCKKEHLYHYAGVMTIPIANEKQLYLIIAANATSPLSLWLKKTCWPRPVWDIVKFTFVFEKLTIAFCEVHKLWMCGPKALAWGRRRAPCGVFPHFKKFTIPRFLSAAPLSWIESETRELWIFEKSFGIHISWFGKSQEMWTPEKKFCNVWPLSS